MRTGFIYGLAEASAKESTLGSIWRKEEMVEECRIKAEKAAFGELLKQFESTWKQVLKQYAKPAH